MKLIYIAIAALVAFIAIWMIFVVPAERKHHERKLESLRSRIEKREAEKKEGDKYAPNESGDATNNPD